MSVNNFKVFFIQHPQIGDAKGKIHKICCICFSQENLRNLKTHKWNDASLHDILEYCLPLQDYTKEWYPRNICKDCIDTLIHTYIFLSKASSAYLILKTKVTGFIDELVDAASAIDSDSDDIIEGGVVNENSLIKEEIKKSDVPTVIKKTEYKCNICKITYEKLKDFRNHLKQIHPEDTRLMCELCGKFFNSTISLSAHKRTHNDKRNYMCDKCGKDLKTANSLRVHINDIHLKKVKPRNHLCTMCGKKFIRSNSLINHMRTHTKEKPYVCGTCGARFSVKPNLRRHTMAHKGIKPFKCHLCGKGFTQKVNLNVHLKNSHINIKPIKCKYCLLKFDYDEDLKNHIESKHKETDKILKNDGFINGCVCNVCGKTFKSKGCLMQHLTIHTGIKNYECSVCEKRFRLGMQLKVHMLIHTNEKPHQCKHCGICFRQKSHLMYHMARHEGARGHVCPYCKKGFNLKGNLKVHVRIHTGETPYICNVCNKGFHDSNGLKRHKKSKHVPVQDKVTVEVIKIESEVYS